MTNDTQRLAAAEALRHKEEESERARALARLRTDDIVMICDVLDAISRPESFSGGAPFSCFGALAELGQIADALRTGGPYDGPDPENLAPERR